MLKKLSKQFLLFSLFLALFLLDGCGGCSRRGDGYRIGIDPNWYPLDFMGKDAYVLGFMEELLLDISKIEGIEFEKMRANWDSIYSKLRDEEYDAVISSLPLYNFNVAKYDFSEVILMVGPVLIIPQKSELTSLDKMSGKEVAIVTEDQSVLSVEKYPDIIIREFENIPEVLNALEKGKVDGAVIDVIPAVSYIKDLYRGKLMISGSPLTDQALRLITMKDTNEGLMKDFNDGLYKLKKKSEYKKLLEKWNLAN